MIGTTVGHFEIVERIGSGGMGEVYRARDTHLDRDVALKFLSVATSAGDAARERFEREAKAAASLNHPNIVTIHEFGEHDGRVFIVMELVDGHTLREDIGRGPMEIDRAVSIVSQIAEGLSKAHAAGVVHRDIKPENIVIDGDGRARILDFGLAKPREAADLTKDNSTVGTVRYMSPEQSAGDDVDRRTDIWSLGVLLYELLVGTPPFKGDHEQAIVYSITNEDHPPVTSQRTGVPLALERIIDKMIAKKKESRYHSAEDLLVDLRSAGGEAASAARKSRPNYMLIGIATVAVIAIALVWFFRPAPRPAEVGKSIAVLPFVNMSEQEDDYFSDGLAEELLNVLARVGDLKVAARTSSFHFKGHTGDISDIAKELNVSTVLEGSVRRAGQKVRVTVQLIDANDGFHIWSHTYDRETGDIFAIQQDIANRVVEELKVTLLGEESAQIAKHPTDNMEAYDAYLLGKHHMAKRTVANLDQAVEYFERAIELDPDFALAYAHLADTYWLIDEYGAATTAETIARMEPLVMKALELDDQLGEVHASLGHLRQEQNDPEGTRAGYERAIELSPNYAAAYQWYGIFLGSWGAYPVQARALLRKAVELDPLSSIINNAYASLLTNAGLADEALKHYKKSIEVDPDVPNPYGGIAALYLWNFFEPDSAIVWFDRAIALDPDNIGRLARRAGYEWYAGRTEAAIDQCMQLIAEYPDDPRPYFKLSDIHQWEGRLGEAYVWARKATERSPGDPWPQARCMNYLLAMGDEEAVAKWHEQFPPMVKALMLPNILAANGDEQQLCESVEQVYEMVGEFYREPMIFCHLLAGEYDLVRELVSQAHPDLVGAAEPHVHDGNIKDAIPLATALKGLGETARADLLLEKSVAYLERLPDRHKMVSGFDALAAAYALQGRKQEALGEIRWGIGAGWRHEWYLLRGRPELKSIRDEAGFKAAFEDIRADLTRQLANIPAELKEPIQMDQN